ncbi:hypothetical protein SOCEGT47_009400 [Sorangium cellulosum]|uniref:Cytochrome c domain-containing protein n=1 Tax=Sorangium cellulosum TaxID=56 RepID=A0A4P2PUX5_SORCE|nr:c-type cytochrome [Sorangium cellulosum]AUX20469.1 hypothetical protein SOCEGT47_009400 [Sorangium cellulosum]
MPIRSILLFCLAPFAIAALQGCGGDDGGDSSSSNHDGEALGECPPDSAAQQTAGYDALQRECVVCHGTDKVGATARIGAPDGMNVDDPEWVRAEAGEIMEEIEAGTMPFGAGKLPDDTIESIRVYLACDAAAQ